MHVFHGKNWIYIFCFPYFLVLSVTSPHSTRETKGGVSEALTRDPFQWLRPWLGSWHRRALPVWFLMKMVMKRATPAMMWNVKIGHRLPILQSKTRKVCQREGPVVTWRDHQSPDQLIFLSMIYRNWIVNEIELSEQRKCGTQFSVASLTCCSPVSLLQGAGKSF